MTNPTIKRMDSVKAVSVDDLVNWCLQRGLNPESVEVTSTHLVYFTPMTDEEVARKEAFAQAAIERTEKWERESLARLQAKYGVEG
jgi:IS1 family transposase